MKEQFPFGQSVKKVEQAERSPKKYFVLGVYASAVHAQWIGGDGKIKVKALAVASEPEIFWQGDRERGGHIISQIAVPKGLGRLELAENRLNGPSGIELDKSYLSPLNITREEVWLCDLLPFARLNDGQRKAINREYEPLREKHGLPEVTLGKVPTCFADVGRVQEILEEVRQSQAKKIILLGDIPIKEFIHRFDKRFARLSDFGEYGNWHNVELDGKGFDVLPLAHPRQTGKLGRSSRHWYEAHQGWIKKMQA